MLHFERWTDHAGLLRGDEFFSHIQRPEKNLPAQHRHGIHLLHDAAIDALEQTRHRRNDGRMHFQQIVANSLDALCIGNRRATGQRSVVSTHPFERMAQR